jgi:hypothetical protein
MIRRAAFNDAPAIMALIRTQHERSKYAGRCRIAEPALEHVVTSIIAQQGQIGPQGSCLFIAEREGKAVAFIAGIVDRIYGVGAKLKAQDLFFVNEHGTVGDTLKLVDAYLAWARSIRAVLEISLSWIDTMPGAEKVGQLYARKGLRKCGEIFVLETDAAPMESAA